MTSFLSIIIYENELSIYEIRLVQNEIDLAY